jgi:hypothetical protein
MANALIRARLRKVWVVENGDKDIEGPVQTKEELEKTINELRKELLKPGLSAYKRSQRLRELAQANEALMAFEEDNTVQATLHYPRSGESAVTAFRTMALGDGEAAGKDFGDDPDFFDSVLFKEEVQGETDLVVEIQDKDPKNPVLRFLRGLAVTLFGNIAKGLLEGVTHVVPSSAGSEVSDHVKSAMKPEKATEKVHVIAESERVEIRLDPAGNLQVTNAKPGSAIEYQNGVLKLKLKTPKKKKVGDLGQNAPNGEVILLLDAEPT